MPGRALARAVQRCSSVTTSSGSAAFFSRFFGGFGGLGVVLGQGEGLRGGFRVVGGFRFKVFWLRASPDAKSFIRFRS